MDISITDIHHFVVTYKWWFAALVPFALAVIVLKARG